MLSRTSSLFANSKKIGLGMLTNPYPRNYYPNNSPFFFNKFRSFNTLIACDTNLNAAKILEQNTVSVLKFLHKDSKYYPYVHHYHVDTPFTSWFEQSGFCSQKFELTNVGVENKGTLVVFPDGKGKWFNYIEEVKNNLSNTSDIIEDYIREKQQERADENSLNSLS